MRDMKRDEPPGDPTFDAAVEFLTNNRRK
jgi:hypothetical protein